MTTAFIPESESRSPLRRKQEYIPVWDVRRISLRGEVAILLANADRVYEATKE
jgi:hypothetical protein